MLTTLTEVACNVTKILTTSIYLQDPTSVAQGGRGSWYYPVRTHNVGRHMTVLWLECDIGHIPGVQSASLQPAVLGKNLA